MALGKRKKQTSKKFTGYNCGKSITDRQHLYWWLFKWWSCKSFNKQFYSWNETILY